jgi:prepilin-type N-terminal cleavage/methylation domain-containing protein
MKRKNAKQSGFSMIEVLVTVFLVTLGLLVVMTSFVAISKAQRYSERMDTASALARLEMERIRNRPYLNIQSEVGAYSEYPDHPDFRHEVIVTEAGNIKQITLRIYFEKDRRRAEVVTYVANM